MTYYDKEQGYNDGKPPVREGEEHDIIIEGLGKEGDGIGKVNKFVIIVPGAQAGDELRVRITKVSRRVAFGEIV